MQKINIQQDFNKPLVNRFKLNETRTSNKLVLDKMQRLKLKHTSILNEIKQSRSELNKINKEISRLNRNMFIKKKIQQQTNPMPYKLYSLRLEGGYWYIGISRDPDKRFAQHRKNKGSNWTKLHKPLEIVEIIDTKLFEEGEAAKLENNMTLEYAKKYGLQLVRGGGYCQMKPKWPDIFGVKK